MDSAQNDFNSLADIVKTKISRIEVLKNYYHVYGRQYIRYKEELHELVSGIEKNMEKLEAMAEEDENSSHNISVLRPIYDKVKDNFKIEEEIARNVTFVDQRLYKRFIRTLRSIDIDPSILRFVLVVAITIVFLYNVP